MTLGRRLALITLAGFVLRLVLLAARGDYVVYDEAYYLLIGRSLLAGEGFSLSGLRHVALSPLQPLVVSALTWLGIPDLFASRLLGAACGALLPVPAALLAARLFGERAADPAAALTAASPALLSLLPFFPGERWNLYFGSEPLFLLLAMSAVLVWWEAVERGGLGWWAAGGLLAAFSYLARLEGAVLVGVLSVVATGALVARRARAQLPRVGLALVIALAACAPYLLYLRSALGRWAISGRVQSAVPAPRPAPSSSPSGLVSASAEGPSDAVNAFVWGGDPEALWRALYALDASGTRMASQYWGTPRPADGRTPRRAGEVTSEPAEAAPPRAEAAPQPMESASTERGPSAVGPGAAARWVRGLSAVLPWWLALLSLAGLALAERRARGLMWLSPLLLAGLLPSALAYVEPRSLLPVVPVACILAAPAVARAAEVLRHAGFAPVALVVALLLVPTGRDLYRAWPGERPLQRAAAARRAVGEYLAARLPPDAAIVSWHPAVALFARRPWRAMPFDRFERVVGYARAQQAALVVFSTLEPSPINNPPRAFTALLLDSRASAAGDSVVLEPVDSTALLFVARLAPAPAP